MNPARKKKMVVLIDWYLPGYKAGGPIQSVASMVSRLNDEFDFAIITADTDLHETTPYAGIRSDEWNTLVDGSRVYYFSKTEKHFSKLKQLMLDEQADVIYLNSLFSVFFTIYPLIIRKNFMPSRKTVLAPRGMLGKGALDIKPFKKKIFLLASRIAGIYKNITWHASTILEAEEVKKNFGKKQKIRIATNLTSPKAIPAFNKTKVVGSARFFFLSRISSKKNLLATISAFSKITAGMKAELHIYGPIDDAAYWEQCKEKMLQLPAHLSIVYKGAIANKEAAAMMSTYHFSLLQTQHENFGHSIVESMAAGCPVIISDQTPWLNLEEIKAGWDIPLADETSLIKVLIQCCEMDQHTFNEWSRSTFEYANAIFNNPALIADNRLVFA